LEIDGGGGGDGAKVGLPVQGLGREWSGESGGVDGGALGSGDGCGGGSGDGAAVMGAVIAATTAVIGWRLGGGGG